MGESHSDERRLARKEKELDRAHDEWRDSRKTKGTSELTLILVCCLAVVYTYPASTLNPNPTVEIKALDLSIPLKAAIALFPTIIACCYLLFLIAAIHVGVSLGKVLRISSEIGQLEQEGTKPQEAEKYSYSFWRRPVIDEITQPTLVSVLPILEGGRIVNIYHRITMWIGYFLGVIFTAIPFLSIIFIIVRAHAILGQWWLLIWNSICVSLMVLMGGMNLVVAYKYKPTGKYDW